MAGSAQRRFASLIDAAATRLRDRFDAPAHGRSGGRRADLIASAPRSRPRPLNSPVHAVVAHSFGALSTAAWLSATPLPTLKGAVLIGLMRDLGYLLDSFVTVLQLRPDVAARLRALLVRRYGAEPEQFSARALAAHIRVPVLIVHGEEDELVPSACRRSPSSSSTPRGHRPGTAPQPAAARCRDHRHHGGVPGAPCRGRRVTGGRLSPTAPAPGRAPRSRKDPAACPSQAQP
jgi:alpha-beta hydrolase superfamily lysophospholipase